MRADGSRTDRRASFVLGFADPSRVELGATALWYRWTMRKYGALTPTPRAVVWTGHFQPDMLCPGGGSRCWGCCWTRRQTAPRRVIYLGVLLGSTLVLLNGLVGLNDWTPPSGRRRCPSVWRRWGSPLLAGLYLLDEFGPWKAMPLPERPSVSSSGGRRRRGSAGALPGRRGHRIRYGAH